MRALAYPVAAVLLTGVLAAQQPAPASPAAATSPAA